MALQYPGYSVPQGYNTKLSDIFDGIRQGFDQGKAAGQEQQARDLLARFGDTLYGTPSQQPGAPATGAAPRAGGDLFSQIGQALGLKSKATPAPAMDAGTMAALGPKDGARTPTANAALASQAPQGVPVGSGYDAYAGAVQQAESSGNAYAKNPNSSATGPYQFIDATWSALMAKHPELGLTPDGRTDPAQAARAMKAFTAGNAKQLAASGLPVNPASLYTAHMLGAGGASKVLSADPSTPLASLLSPEAVQANPQLADMTAGDFVQWAGTKASPGGKGYHPPSTDANGGWPMPQGKQVPLPPKELLVGLLQNPVTRELGMSLVQQSRAAGLVDQFQTFTGPDGGTWQVNIQTGEMKSLKGPGSRPLTADEKAAYGIAPNVPAQISADGKVDVIGSGSASGAQEYSLSPIYGRDASGNVVPMQVGKNGQAIATTLPNGVTALSPFELAGGKAGATVDAKTAAEARAALPGMEQAAKIANDALNLITNDTQGLNEQFGNILGVPQRNLPVTPGTSLGNWQANFAQAKGQSFMQARQMLKGGGPITDFEGAKADAAYSRMEQAAALGDKQNFLMAADDFRQAVASGLEKLRSVANGDYTAGQPAVTGNGGTSADPLGIR
jgi:hypothetical protein